MRKHELLFLIFFLFSQLYFLTGEVIKTPSSDIDEWYSRGVFYEIFIRSFKDSNGSRFGDFNGVIEKMDYIEKLGVSALWFMPINDSAEKTNNYDPIDYFNVDPTYGTLDDFKRLLDEAHKRDIRVIIDFVINHTSDKHPFFIDASTNRNSKYRDWYIFKDEKPSGSWSQYWRESPAGYYYAYFVDSKPDLNFKNPAVLAYMKDVMKFWLDMGVDGFRFDAVTLLVENGDGKIKNQPESYEVFRNLRKFIDEEYPDRKLFKVAESEAPYNSYLGNGSDMFHAVFNFRFNSSIIRMVSNNMPFTNRGVSMVESLAVTNRNDLKDTPGAFYATLLSNHDLYAGLRPFAQFNQDIGKTKLAGAILLTIPGIPFVYYGEELAMDTYKVSRHDRWLRTCMMWDNSKNFGFSTHDRPWNFINANDEEINKKYNAETQENDPDSILNHYRKLINARKNNPALSLGDFLHIDAKNNMVQSYLRKHGENEVIVIHNFSDKPQNAVISLAGIDYVNNSGNFENLMETKTAINISKGTLRVRRLLPYQTLLIKLK